MKYSPFYSIFSKKTRVFYKKMGKFGIFFENFAKFREILAEFFLKVR